MSEFEIELAELLKKYRRSNRSITPDHILVGYLVACLDAFDKATNDRASWLKSNV